MELRKADQSKLGEMTKILEEIDADMIIPGHDGPQPKTAVLNSLKNELERLSSYNL